MTLILREKRRILIRWSLRADWVTSAAQMALWWLTLKEIWTPILLFNPVFLLCWWIHFLEICEQMQSSWCCVSRAILSWKCFTCACWGGVEALSPHLEWGWSNGWKCWCSDLSVSLQGAVGVICDSQVWGFCFVIKALLQTLKVCIGEQARGVILWPHFLLLELISKLCWCFTNRLALGKELGWLEQVWDAASISGGWDIPGSVLCNRAGWWCFVLDEETHLVQYKERVRGELILSQDDLSFYNYRAPVSFFHQISFAWWPGLQGMWQQIVP